jgi:hypothetical protein
VLIWRHTLNDVTGVQRNTTNTICAIEGANISHLRKGTCVFQPTMLCEEYTVVQKLYRAYISRWLDTTINKSYLYLYLYTGRWSKPFWALLTWEFTLIKSSNKWITAQVSNFLHYIRILTIVQSNKGLKQFLRRFIFVITAKIPWLLQLK